MISAELSLIKAEEALHLANRTYSNVCVGVVDKKNKKKRLGFSFGFEGRLVFFLFETFSIVFKDVIATHS